MTHAPLVMPSYFDLFSVSMWRGEDDLNRLSLDEYFFLKRKKSKFKISIFRNTRMGVDGTLVKQCNWQSMRCEARLNTG